MARKEIGIGVITSQDDVIKLAYDAYIDHTKECEGCTAVLVRIRKLEDPEEVFKAVWKLGFESAMYLILSGQLMSAGKASSSPRSQLSF